MRNLICLLLACLTTTLWAEEPRNPYRAKVAQKERQKHLQQERVENERQLPAAENGAASGRRILLNAIDQFNSYRSVSAQLRQHVDMYGHHLVGTGRYLQLGQGENRKVRMELKIQAADQITSLVQVCDGRNLYTHQDLLGDVSLSKVDVLQIRLRLDQDQERMPLLSASAWSAFGGLSRLLANLDASFNFGRADESELDDVGVWVMQGTWKPERLSEFLPDQAASIATGEKPDLSQLPPQIPHRVIIAIGRDDWFPYRVEYQRRVKTEHKGESPTYSTESLMTLEGYDVKFDIPLGEEEFEFSPGEQECVDKTQEYLQELLAALPAKPKS